MTRAEALSRQDALRAVLTATGWRRRTAQGDEFWYPPDLVGSEPYTFEAAVRLSIAATKHPYTKSVLKQLGRAREEYERLNPPPATKWERGRIQTEIDPSEGKQ